MFSSISLSVSCRPGSFDLWILYVTRCLEVGVAVLKAVSASASASFVTPALMQLQNLLLTW